MDNETRGIEIKTEYINDEQMEKGRFWLYVSLPILWTFSVIALLVKPFVKRAGLQKKIKRVASGNLSPFKKVMENIGSSQALVIIYEKPNIVLVMPKNFSKKDWQDYLSKAILKFLYELRNSRGVRNRLKIVERTMCEEEERIPLDRPWNVLCVACGSAKATLKAVQKRKNRGGKSRVVLIDHNESALRDAMKIATENGVEDMVETICGDAIEEINKLKDFLADTVEIVGLTDYFFKDDKMIRLLLAAWNKMAPKAKLVTGNIVPNLESFFLTYGMNWKMQYRTLTDMKNIAIAVASGVDELVKAVLKIESQGIFIILSLAKS